MKGIVKWFSAKRGYGFIHSEGIEEDIYIHFSEIKKDGFKTLRAGDHVMFDYDSEKNRAHNLSVIPKSKDNEE